MLLKLSVKYDNQCCLFLQQGSTALHWAAQLGADNVIAFLLRHRAEVNAVNKVNYLYNCMLILLLFST